MSASRMCVIAVWRQAVDNDEPSFRTQGLSRVPEYGLRLS